MICGAIVIAIVLMFMSSCKKKESTLDPDNPITISVWHYYNGSVKNRFDSLVNQFNETVGMDHGVVVDAQSYGDVNELADAVYNSASNRIGAQPMPDIFAAYPDNAYRVSQIAELVGLEDYFSEEELAELRKDFLQEGQFGEDGKLKILPIAKSTENLYLNKTYWDEFAEETGADIRELSTWEGIQRIAKLYYDHTGKAFFCIDANANFMLLAAMQLGDEMYTYGDYSAEMNLREEVAYKIWDNYYVPYIKGYFAKSGRFSSDDAKTGKVIAYTGSTAGASYFPTEITDEGRTVSVDVMTLPYPHFQDEKLYAIQQGAGMCITKSDKSHEYGSAMFLKWFIKEPQNVQFAVSTAYFPVKNDSLKEEILVRELDKSEVSVEAIKKSIKTTMDMLNSYTLYGSRPFEGSYDMRSLLENSLFGYVKEDLKRLESRVTSGEDREKVIQELISRENFKTWYEQFVSEANQILLK
jgi:multiple sugar transport system substrate-binding protein